MPQATAALLIEQYESAISSIEAINLHITRVHWDTPEQFYLLTSLKTRYESLTDELRYAIAAFGRSRPPQQ